MKRSTRKAGLAYPVRDELKGRGKVQGFGRTSEAERIKERVLTDMVKERRPVEVVRNG